MSVLIAGLILFFGTHLVPMVPGTRQTLVSRLGERGYKGAFSLVALAGLVLIVVGFATAGLRQWFAPLPEAVAIAPYAVAVAFILLAASHMRGHLRAALKHPMLLGVFVWAVVHLLANGDARGTVLFGTFAVYAVVDIFSATMRRTAVAFEPSAKHDVRAVVAGVVAAVVVMALHRILFGVPVVPFSL